MDETQNNEQTNEAVASAAPGVLIDNDTGENTPPHPLSAGVGGASDNEGSDGTNSGDQGGGSAEDEQVVEDDKGNTGAAQATATADTPAAQAPQVQASLVEDPGEFKPKDYAFDITLADGSVIKIEKPEDIQKIPKEADFGTPQQFFEVQAAYNRMVGGIDADKREYEANKKAFDDQQASVQSAEDTIASWEKELTYLQGKGKLPAVPAQYANADWRDPEIAKQPGVKERVEIINYMNEENKAREAAGLPPMKSMLEAFNQMQVNAYEQRAQESQERQNTVRKQRGAMVGGASAPAPSKSNSDMIVGSGGSLRDLG